ncbi:MAG: DUF5074 domain-containing protein [Vicingaceae bacterium]
MKQILSILTLIFLFSCSKKELGPQCVSCNEDTTPTTVKPDVLIINEGNFGNGSGSISLYNTTTKTIDDNQFFEKNGFPIGNVVQSGYQINNKAYIVVNNSNKIEVIDINDFSSLHTITGFNSPRYFLPISQNTAYVTDLYSNSIQIVDLNANTITGNIQVNGWTENLIIHNDSVYVCDMTNDNILIINPNNHTIIDSVKVGESPNSIVKDKNNKLWIMCSGGFSSSNPELIKFNPQTRTIENTFVFSVISESPGNLSINKDGSSLYYINSNVYKMNIDQLDLPSSPIITNNGNTFYQLGIHPINEEIYVSDAIDYIQDGLIFRYDSNGNLIHQFNAGVIPGNFLFIQ